MWKNTPFVLHMYSIRICTTIIQAVVDGDLCCIVHCSVTTLSTIDGQWDNEDTFSQDCYPLQFSQFNSIHFKFSLFHFRSPITCLCSTIYCSMYTYTGVQCGVYMPIHRGTVWCANILNKCGMEEGTITTTDSL